MKSRLFATSTLALLCMSGCTTTRSVSPLGEQSAVEAADKAYRQLPSSLPAYNSAVRVLAERLEKTGPAGFGETLKQIGVGFSYPQTGLTLKHVEVSEEPADPNAFGVPVVLEYDAANSPIYPPEGLLVDAAAVCRKIDGKFQLSLLHAQKNLTVNSRPMRLAIDPAGASNHLKSRTKRLAASGFISMIRPESMKRKPRIYLLDPYDSEKTPLLMVHGLQSTPIAFAKLVNALRADPEIRSKYQIWQFYYPSGAPVLVNAAALRESLKETLATLDPDGSARANHRIVVIGHSMGGVISHTLASSSGGKVWSSVFQVPPSQLKGDPAAIRNFEHIAFFSRDPHVGRVIFMAAPHRGSPMADSFIGRLGTSLTRLGPMAETGFSILTLMNNAVMHRDAAEFSAGGRYSAVRTLSSKSTALIAVANLPIPIPFHNIIGQRRPGPKQGGSDGVVPYWSSHLDGADSESIVRSGHNIIKNPEAIAEVIRILRQHQNTL